MKVDSEAAGAGSEESVDRDSEVGGDGDGGEAEDVDDEGRDGGCDGPEGGVDMYVVESEKMPARVGGRRSRRGREEWEGGGGR